MAAGGGSAAAGSGRRGGGGGTSAATVPDAGLRESAAADAAQAQLRFPASQLYRCHAGYEKSNFSLFLGHADQFYSGLIQIRYVFPSLILANNFLACFILYAPFSQQFFGVLLSLLNIGTGFLLFYATLAYIIYFIFAGCYDNNPWYLVTNLAGHLDLAGFYFLNAPLI
jgi:hypothetical protein